MWAYRHGVKLDYTRPGKPTDNGLIESFNGRLRDEFLNVHEFITMPDMRARLRTWQHDYNVHRHELVDVEELVAQPPVERLDQPVVRGLAG